MGISFYGNRLSKKFRLSWNSKRKSLIFQQNILVPRFVFHICNDCHVKRFVFQLHHKMTAGVQHQVDPHIRISFCEPPQKVLDHIFPQSHPCSKSDLLLHRGSMVAQLIHQVRVQLHDHPSGFHIVAPYFRLAEDLEETMIMGSFEYYNYLLTLPDHTKILIWGGEASPECIRRAGHYDPDISIVQIPREGARAIADLYKAVGGKVIFPHHHETILDLEGGPDLISDMLDLVHREAPGTEVICPRKGVWYRIGMQIHEEA